MEHKKAITILMGMIEKHLLSKEEKEAVLTSVGVLDWVARGKSRIKALKAKKDKSTEW